MRLITIWRSKADPMSWDIYISESEKEAGEVMKNLTNRGIDKVTTYNFGDVVEGLSIG